MRRFLLYIFFIAFLSPNVFCQRTLQKIADNALKANEYTFAINNYKSLFSQIENEDPLKATIAYKIGYCYRHISEPLHAQLWLNKAIELNYQDPIVYLYCADAMRMNQNFDKAITYYNKYNELVPSDKRGEKGVESCRTAKKWLKNPTNYKITNLAYINSESSDFSPFFLDDGKSNLIYFSSSRTNSNGDRIHGGSGQHFCDIFSSKEDSKGLWLSPNSISEQINTTNEEGSPSLTKDGNFIFYTQCNYGDNHYQCKIMSSSKIGSSWDKPNVLDLSEIPNDTSDYVHPCVSADGLKIYFASNRPGGYGGYDIWYCTRASSKEKWGKPKNAGEVVNTDGDELFPYYRSADSILYFSSNGHIGMGGLDIFRVNYDAKGKPYTLNLMSPINSPSDDFGITFRDSLEEGYFSSNRPGGKGYDDIYHFSIIKLHFKVKGQVLDEITEKPIANATVSLIGSDGTSIETTTNENGDYEFDLNPQTNYVLLSIHEGYLNSKYKISTYGRKEDKNFDVNLYMTQLDSPIEVQNVLYDVNLWDLRPESIVSLNKLYETLIDNPHIIIELSSHTDYRVGNKMTNEELSQRRAQSVVNFLINKGIDKNRLTAKGYGATQPKVVDHKTASLYKFLNVGDKLTPEFIQSLNSEQQEICHQINRRTEFKVTSTNFNK
ncbi:MAG: OmpA family protein [Bacteroidales bacterium]|nr:OmpA family protein [Bacteroidales bacterium]